MTRKSKETSSEDSTGAKAPEPKIKNGVSWRDAKAEADLHAATPPIIEQKAQARKAKPKPVPKRDTKPAVKDKPLAKKAAPPKEKIAEPTSEQFEAKEELVSITYSFRSPGTRPKEQPKQFVEKTPTERKGRRQRIQKSSGTESESAPISETIVETKQKSSRFTPDLSNVETPEGAPRIVRYKGRPCLLIGKEIIPPLFFFGNPSDEARAKTVLGEIAKAAEAGIHVHSLMVEFTVEAEAAQHSFDLATYLLDEVLKVDPQAYVMFRVVIAGEPNWEKKFPDAVFRLVDGSLAEPSLGDEEFWEEAERLLGGFVKGLRSLPNAQRILGLHIDRGEWFFAEGWGYDTSPAGERAFRDWTRHRYGDDPVALQAAWFDGRARFEGVRVPDYTELPMSGENFLRSGRKERRWVDYHLFLSDLMVLRIQRLANIIKRSSEGWFVVAVSYGYTFEWAHPASGHLSLGKLLRTRDVDIIAGPPSYKDRQMGGAAAFPGPIDSFALNNKLYISEEDFKTPISKTVEPDEFNPVMATPQALEAAHWRGLGSALAHGTGICWMDLWGNGWLDTPAIWKRAEQVRDALSRALASEEADPDVAVLIDERSLAYLSDSRAFKQLVQDSREAVLRAGVSAGFYLLSDLAHRVRFPDAKLYIFLNAWDVRQEVRNAIKNRLQRDGKTLFWVYAAGLLEHGRDSMERVREVTGIALRAQPFNSKAGTTILNRRHQLTELLEERALSVVEQLEPSYFAIPETGCTVLGEYTQTGLPSFIVREIDSEENEGQRWRSVFLGEPLINERIIRGLCELAGVQVWNYHGDVVHVRRPFLSVHYSGTGHRTATLPERWHAYDLVQGKMMGADATHFRSQATDGATSVFVVGEERQVQDLTDINPETLLHLEEVPEQEPDIIQEEVPETPVALSGFPDANDFLELLADSVDSEFVESADLAPKPKQKRTRRSPTSPKPREKNPKKKQDPSSLGVVFRDKT